MESWQRIERGRAEVLTVRSTEDLEIEVEVEVPLSAAPPTEWRAHFSSIARPPLLPGHLSPPTLNGAVLSFQAPRDNVGDYLIALDELIVLANDEFERKAKAIELNQD